MENLRQRITNGLHSSRSSHPLSSSGSPDAGTADPTALQGEVTELLQRVTDGQPNAASALMPLIYGELQRIARSYMHRERSDHTLQPTALVHEAYLRMIGQTRVSWQSRGHFLSMAATMMRRILVDSSREQIRIKRGAGAVHEELVAGEMQIADSPLAPEELLALNEALERLATRDARMAQIVELRFFAGLDVPETAQILGVSEPTIKRNWSVARAWLARELGGA